MTDLSFHAAPATSRSVSPRVALHAGLLAASTTGVLLGQSGAGDTSGFEPNLLLLLRFMAALKFAGVVAAALLVHWRLTRPTPRRLALGYVAAIATMAVAPGLIWSLSHVAVAAVLFHAGLLGFMALAWKDTDALPDRTARRVRVRPIADFDPMGIQRYGYLDATRERGG